VTLAELNDVFESYWFTVRSLGMFQTKKINFTNTSNPYVPVKILKTTKTLATFEIGC